MNETGSFSHPQRGSSNSMIQLEQLPSNQNENNETVPIVSQGNRIVRSSSESQSLNTNTQYATPTSTIITSTHLSSSGISTSTSSGTSSGSSSVDSTQIISSSYSDNHSSPSLSSSISSVTGIMINSSALVKQIQDSPQKGHNEEDTQRPLLAVSEEGSGLHSNNFPSRNSGRGSGSGQKLLSNKNA